MAIIRRKRLFGLYEEEFWACDYCESKLEIIDSERTIKETVRVEPPPGARDVGKTRIVHKEIGGHAKCPKCGLKYRSCTVQVGHSDPHQSWFSVSPEEYADENWRR